MLRRGPYRSTKRTATKTKRQASDKDERPLTSSGSGKHRGQWDMLGACALKLAVLVPTGGDWARRVAYWRALFFGLLVMARLGVVWHFAVAMARFIMTMPFDAFSRRALPWRRGFRGRRSSMRPHLDDGACMFASDACGNAMKMDEPDLPGIA